jgi:hypothetical protein
MKISFESGEYIEVLPSNGKVMLAIASKHPTKPKSLLINSAEITVDQFKQLSLGILQEKEI